MYSLKPFKNPDKTYLVDQPILSKIIRSWLETIDLHSDYCDKGIEELECMSRDGFVAASHNCGGFDRIWLTDLNWFNGTGYGCGALDSRIEEQIEHNLKLAEEHCTENKITEDEERYEVENEFLRDAVWLGVRCMYEGIDERGVHTLMVYCGGNISEYYGPHQNGSSKLAEFELRFKTAASLRRQLKRITNKVLNAFGGGK